MVLSVTTTLVTQKCTIVLRVGREGPMRSTDGLCHTPGAEAMVLLFCRSWVSCSESQGKECREGRGCLGLGEEALCPVGAHPSIYNLNLYSGHQKAAASCIVMYIAQQSCKYLVLCINKPACFDRHGPSPYQLSCALTKILVAKLNSDFFQLL